MFCTKCGKEIPDTSNFCKFCGNKMKQQNQAQKTIKVAFHRQKRFTGCLVPMDIYIDKKVVGTLNNDGIFEIDVPCGEHQIIVEMWSCVSEKKVNFSEEHTKAYIEIKLKMGAITNKPEIVDIRFEK